MTTLIQNRNQKSKNPGQFLQQWLLGLEIKEEQTVRRIVKLILAQYLLSVIDIPYFLLRVSSVIIKYYLGYVIRELFYSTVVICQSLGCN